ncbi:hypothetical protein P8452_48124 [Trifolium repens]|nr:hypothetical protein P8452_48124 [Trifolium repens]
MSVWHCRDAQSVAIRRRSLSSTLTYAMTLSKKRLTIQSSELKMLYADIISPSHLISLKYLKFDCVNLDEREELLYIISVLKSASNLVELVIQSYNYGGEREPNQPEEFECNSCCLNQLQTVNIKHSTGMVSESSKS